MRKVTHISYEESKKSHKNEKNENEISVEERVVQFIFSVYPTLRDKKKSDLFGIASEIEKICTLLGMETTIS
jgi:DNA polymerase III delta subunit